MWLGVLTAEQKLREMVAATTWRAQCADTTFVTSAMDQYINVSATLFLWGQSGYEGWFTFSLPLCFSWPFRCCCCWSHLWPLQFLCSRRYKTNTAIVWMDLSGCAQCQALCILCTRAVCSTWSQFQLFWQSVRFCFALLFTSFTKINSKEKRLRKVKWKDACKDMILSTLIRQTESMTICFQTLTSTDCSSLGIIIETGLMKTVFGILECSSYQI